MNVAIFGATGGTGRALLNQALDQGHDVVVLARTPEKVEREHPNLTIMKGDVLNAIDVSNAVAGVDAVLVSLGQTKNNPDNVVSKGTSHIIKGMQDHGISRLLVVTSLGVGETKNDVPFFFKVLMKTVLRNIMADKEIQEQLLRDSRLDWTIVRPGGLNDQPKSGQYEASTDKVMAGTISRADVADFILQELQEGAYIQQAVGVTGSRA